MRSLHYDLKYLVTQLAPDTTGLRNSCLQQLSPYLALLEDTLSTLRGMTQTVYKVPRFISVVLLFSIIVNLFQ